MRLWNSLNPSRARASAAEFLDSAAASPDDALLGRFVTQVAAPQVDTWYEPAEIATMRSYAEVGRPPTCAGRFVVVRNLGAHGQPARPKGDFAIGLHADDVRSLRVKRSALLTNVVSGSTLRIQAAVLPNSELDRGHVAMDETLRDALGLHVGDGVQVTSTATRAVRGRALDVITRRRYLVVRTQVSDFTAFETST